MSAGTTAEAPTIFRLLDLSTGHLKLSTRTVLDSGGRDANGAELFLPRIVPHEYGWFMWADTDPGNVDAFPEDIAAATRLAHHLKCEWILFDQDAVALSVLPYYGDGEDPEPLDYHPWDGMDEPGYGRDDDGDQSQEGPDP